MSTVASSLGAMSPITFGSSREVQSYGRSVLIRMFTSRTVPMFLTVTRMYTILPGWISWYQFGDISSISATPLGVSSRNSYPTLNAFSSSSEINAPSRSFFSFRNFDALTASVTTAKKLIISSSSSSDISFGTYTRRVRFSLGVPCANFTLETCLPCSSNRYRNCSGRFTNSRSKVRSFSARRSSCRS